MWIVSFLEKENLVALPKIIVPPKLARSIGLQESLCR